METNELFDDHYRKTHMRGGTSCCPGCGGPLFWRMTLEVLGPKTVVYGDGPCWRCALRNIDTPFFGLSFSFVADGATGIVASLTSKGRDDITVVSSAGDGATADLSLGKISAAAERDENMIQICIDNEAYMNTGIQKSGLTPWGAWTTTTPRGKELPKKDVPLIIAQHHVPYVATTSIAYPKDLQAKIRKAQGTRGFKYIHTVIPCPTGWRFDPAKSIEVVRLGVDTWAWPLYEVQEGVLKVTLKPKPRPVENYLKIQDRFRHLSEDQVKSIQDWVDSRRSSLLENDGKKIII